MKWFSYAVLPVLTANAIAVAAAITPGNLVVYRVDNTGTPANGTAVPVVLDEFTTAGALVQSIAMPTTTLGGSFALTATNNGNTEGALTVSPNGQWVALTGFGIAAGTANATTTPGNPGPFPPRVVGIINASTGAVDTTTGLTDFAPPSGAGPTGQSPRTAVTTDGNSIWVAGTSSGIRYATKGSTTSTPITTDNATQLRVQNGRLYAAIGTNVRRVSDFSVALPTSSATVQPFPGISNSTTVGANFVLADVSPTVDAGNGFDTLYTTEGNAAAIKKFVFNPLTSNWDPAGSLTSQAVVSINDQYRGIDAKVVGTDVTLFAVRNGNSLVSYLDATGFGGILPVGPTAVTELAVAGSNQFFRGVAFVPEPASLSMLGLSALALGRRRRV